MVANGARLAGEEAARIVGEVGLLEEQGDLEPNTAFEVQDHLESEPSEEARTILYRIAQEAINNAIKHGRSTEIRIELADTSDRTTLTVQNNGLAISKQRSRKEDGLGLRIMQYRAGMMGGSLSIESHARRGTTLTCTIPKG